MISRISQTICPIKIISQEAPGQRLLGYENIPEIVGPCDLFQNWYTQFYDLTKMQHHNLKFKIRVKAKMRESRPLSGEPVAGHVISWWQTLLNLSNPVSQELRVSEPSLRSGNLLKLLRLVSIWSFCNWSPKSELYIMVQSYSL